MLASLRGPAFRQFLTFGLIGTGGFVVDASVLYAAMAAGAGHYRGRAVSYLVAATFTWAMNRRFTFHAHRSPDRLREWMTFLMVNSLGGALNYGTYALLVANSQTVAALPLIGVAAGSLVGLMTNFFLSRRIVFRRH